MVATFIIQSKKCNNYKIPYLSTTYRGFTLDKRKEKMELESKKNVPCAWGPETWPSLN